MSAEYQCITCGKTFRWGNSTPKDHYTSKGFCSAECEQDIANGQKYDEVNNG